MPASCTIARIKASLLAMPANAEYHLCWDEFHRDALALAAQLTGGQWAGVIGIARGGLIAATIIARELDLRFVDSLCIASYNHTEQTNIDIIKPVTGDGSGMLVVDDLVDTGKTLEAARAMLPQATFAVVYAKPAAAALTDYASRDFDQDTWIHFPWDLGQSYRPPMVAV